MRKGFTLMELLIALMIFSLISIGALSSVNHMMRAREQQQMHHQTNLQLDQAYAHLFQDLLWFMGELEASSHSMKFIRTANTETEGHKQIIYELREGELWRRVGEVSVLILSEVEDLELSWLLINKSWVSDFDYRQERDFPLLLRVKFKAPNLGEVVWVYATPHL